MNVVEILNPIIKLSKDEKKAAMTLGDDEARFLVDAYYMMQDNRIRNGGQIRSMEKTQEPHDVLIWLEKQNSDLEESIKKALDSYSINHPIGDWLRSVDGIGPVISAGLLAHLDIKKAPTNGHFWSYAGLDPRMEWKKGEKRPFNATLKTLCWKVGESFVKVCNKDTAYYGQLYKQRKDVELAKNEAGEFAEQARLKLEKFKIGKDTDAYKCYSVGKLPPAHIHARAKRYAVKRFLSDLHYVWFMHEYGVEPPAPYPIAHLGHAHWIKPTIAKTQT
jgi:hypothetical protein